MKLIKLTVVMACVLLHLGCRTNPACVGTYRAVVTPEIQAASERLAKSAGRGPSGQDLRTIWSSQTLMLNADGTAELKDAISGQDVKGAYALDGDKLAITMSLASGAPGPRMVYAYDANAHTLTLTAGVTGATIAKGPIYKRE